MYCYSGIRPQFVGDFLIYVGKISRIHFFTLTLKDGEWVFDRSASGEAIVGVEKDPDSLAGIRRMPFSGKEEVTLTVVMDEFSVEIFEDGRALSATIYPPADADGLELTVKARDCCYERADILLK